MVYEPISLGLPPRHGPRRRRRDAAADLPDLTSPGTMIQHMSRFQAVGPARNISIMSAPGGIQGRGDLFGEATSDRAWSRSDGLWAGWTVVGG